MRLVIMQFSTSSCYFLSLRSKNSQNTLNLHFHVASFISNNVFYIVYFLSVMNGFVFIISFILIFLKELGFVKGSFFL